MRHRVDTGVDTVTTRLTSAQRKMSSLAFRGGARCLFSTSIDTHRVHGAICAGQIQMDQAVGLRQEQIQVLQRHGNREASGWKRRAGRKTKRLCDFRRVLTEASSPDRTPGFLLRSRCRRELEYASVEHRA